MRRAALNEVEQAESSRSAGSQVPCNGRPDRGRSNGTNVQVKYRVGKSVALYACFLGMGLVTASSTLGASLVTMEQLLGTDTKTISYAFTGSSLGFLTGVVLCGATFDRINRELLIGLAALLQGISAAVAPWTGHVYAFILIIFFLGLGLGYSDSGGNSYCLLLWRGHALQNPFLQGIHFVWSIGSTAGPYIVRHFLIPIQGNTSLALHANPGNYTPDEMDNYVSTNNTDGNVPVISANGTDITYVRFAYAAVAVVALLAGVSFIIHWILGGCKFLDKLPADYGEGKDGPEPENAETKVFRIRFLSLMCLSFFLYLGYEGTVSKFIPIFLIRYLNWEVTQGALATSAFWGAVAIGRLVNIPVSAFVRQHTMLIVNFTGTITGLILMFFVHYNVAIVWISVTLTGLSLSSTFATGVLWASQHIRVTGVASSVFLIGSSLSSMIYPPFVGYMFQTYSPLWLLYIALGSAVAHTLLTIATYIYATYHKKHHIEEQVKAEELKPIRKHRDSSHVIVDPVHNAINL